MHRSSPRLMARGAAFGLILALFCVAADPATAQRPQMPKERIRAAGTIKGMRGNLMHVQTQEGDQYLLKVEAQPKDISFGGSADPSWLRPGMLVRFTGRFNKKGEPQAPVSDLTVFTLREDSKIGVFADLNAGAKNLFSGDDEKKDDSMAFLVAGRLTGVRNGKISVAAGQAVVKTELDESATIKVDIADLRLAKPGDSIRFEGWYHPLRKQEIYANRLEITAAEPIGSPQKPAAGGSGEEPDGKSGEQPKEKPGEQPAGKDQAEK